MAVPRIGRVLDVVAGALVIIGAAFYLNAYVGLEALRAKPAAEFAQGMAIDRLAEFHSLERLSLTGLAIAIAGMVTAVAAAILARRLARPRRTTLTEGS